MIAQNRFQSGHRCPLLTCSHPSIRLDLCGGLANYAIFTDVFGLRN